MIMIQPVLAMLGWQEILPILIIVLLFGTKKLRTLGGDLGSAVKGFKKAIGDDDSAPAAKKEEVVTNTETTTKADGSSGRRKSIKKDANKTGGDDSPSRKKDAQKPGGKRKSVAAKATKARKSMSTKQEED